MSAPQKDWMKISPEDFQDPSKFTTPFDTPDVCAKQYQKGLEIGRGATEVGAGVSGAWYSHDVRRGFQGEVLLDEDGEPVTSVRTSYERIGYHAGTADLWRGFLDSGCRVVVVRWAADETGKTDAVRHVIREGEPREWDKPEEASARVRM